jgi:hypothetical protein
MSTKIKALEGDRFPATDEHMDQLYLEYRHDQAEIQRDAIMELVNNTDPCQLEQALYDYFYNKATI